MSAASEFFRGARIARSTYAYQRNMLDAAVLHLGRTVWTEIEPRVVRVLGWLTRGGSR